MFKRILIANRGEIACRIIKTAKSMAIETVAVYSEADRSSLHVKQADFAEFIGPAPASESYLDIDAIIGAAKKWQADAIHPGYGFLSENPKLAKACSENGIVFIGPSTSAIEAMGSKSQAKAIMSEANVPLVPGYHGTDNSVEHLLAEADKIGYPVMLKATQGGGGKGMRVVNSAAEMPLAIDGAQREALSSFGDKQLLIEKCILQPRHVEVQVFADQHGHCIYLSDRDCSIQRRHQKVVEEAPAPGLSDELRKQMGEAAVQAAQAIDYVGAGTVEFLLDSRGEFYFMEMNTRLQVEHPVTELITGVDLVEWQFKVAAGEHLPISQSEITHNGHSIELRIYAEDADNDFMPSTGCIDYLQEPISDNNARLACVRVDSGVTQGDTISEYYDPMISKLIVWGQTRDIALKQLKQALTQYHVCGVTTNIGYLHSIISQPAFANIELDTGFLVTHQQSINEQQSVSDSIWLTLTAVTRWSVLTSKSGSSTLPAPTTQGFRLSVNNVYRFNFTDANANHQVRLQQSSQDTEAHFTVRCGEELHQVTLLESDNPFIVDINNVRYTFNALNDEQKTTVFYLGQQRTFEHQPSFESPKGKDDELSPTAPLNGVISAVMVNKGDEVAAGDPLLVLEAMKMEYTITAPVAATVDELFYQHGDQVQHGSILLHLISAPDNVCEDKEHEYATSEG
ncbi:TPA: acetyl/propionyl/methylcrotonyl-CoA carboxylase subunit alpha [Vibrio parahaemolyticus]|uniref:acetyl/propionyl/methylcrotonyl-CoA carboxylase subunit alpha n=1 Tax=Vibrio parahaemolyticus TaxID=670 RepID=UPI0015DF9CB6|nr:acetyl/propionyl/methylcrotonyl-CoA carboxylase subunit alpha [Vibrio parahaemolyticus]HCE1931728.1 acetyl/propionyl/methylcrotonyl-CoA carboxylase subunit alpha [Vibrio parahaemolyticus]HCE4529035.1 acetyl/propionyl/methylcrotonyl-CoA carboxylase subunit alpha [Vibrio parahaemolyticus]HCG7284715.1 acetyl/propionyl/methylcrotonyl-CoA carboxylase subunit alpha [Vibrio parahaemolyticus]HCG8322779.1 acetyl/propionyl/methylcrotonyl-CoA carboxylase subunit alpha [Vibrio parahaemolyticus]HCH07119